MPTFNSLKSYATGYLSTNFTTPTIVAGTPVVISFTNLVLDAVNFEVSGNSIKYTGERTVQFQGVASISMSASVNNTIIKFFTAKNGVIDVNSEIDRKIGTGGDAGALSLTFGGSLATNDMIGLYVDSTLNGTVTIRNFVFIFENVTM